MAKKRKIGKAPSGNILKSRRTIWSFTCLTGAEDAGSVKYYIRSVGPDRVVGVGGDGTIKMLAELLQNTDIPLGIIPAGSANGMARELEIPADIDAALDIAVNGDDKTH